MANDPIVKRYSFFPFPEKTREGCHKLRRLCDIKTTFSPCPLAHLGDQIS